MKSSLNMWTRREALGAGTAALAGTLTFSSCSPGSREPENIIFLVPDGMSTGVPSMAEPFSRRVRNASTCFYALASNPDTTRGFFDTASMNSLVTDSAAAASAWGSGRRVHNCALNTYPDGTCLTPLIPLIKETGRRCGLVTTTRITHATPAGFCAVSRHRDFEDSIAPQYLNLVDVLMGGGGYYFDPDYRTDSKDLVQEYRNSGYSIYRERSHLAPSSAPEKILGLFYPDHLPFALDRLNQPRWFEKIPSLGDMTQVALASLRQSRKGFFLMVEGGRVDHAAHYNDAAGILWEQLDFDDALQVALDFQSEHPDTLIITASDHGNANPGLNGMGPGYRATTQHFERLTQVKASSEFILGHLKEQIRLDSPDASAIRNWIKQTNGCPLTFEEARAVLDAAANQPVQDWNELQRNFYGLLGQIMGNWCGVGWTGTNHTSDWTTILAKGPGQDSFAGLMPHTGFFTRICDFWNIRYSNPEFSAATH